MANYTYTIARMLHFYKFTISRRCSKPEKRQAMPAHKPQAVSDWLIPHSLGTISAFGKIANLA